MRNTVELLSKDVDLVVAALLSMSCSLCPLHPEEGCADTPRCRSLAEHLIGGELPEVYGAGGE